MSTAGAIIGPLVLADLRYALESSSRDIGAALPERHPEVPPLPAFDRIDDILYWYWDGNEPRGGTEIDLRVVFAGDLLVDEGYWYLAAWNDYTGWGCQDGASFRWAPTLTELWRFGLEAEDRARWSPVPEELNQSS
jgi:hypothetical protein